MTDRNTAKTVHGEIEYETVTCDSCGNEILQSDAKRFVIGDHVRTKSWSGSGDELEFRNYTMGWACEICQNNGPVEFPESLFGSVDKDALGILLLKLSLALFMLYIMVVVFV